MSNGYDYYAGGSPERTQPGMNPAAGAGQSYAPAYAAAPAYAPPAYAPPAYAPPAYPGGISSGPPGPGAATWPPGPSAWAPAAPPPQQRKRPWLAIVAVVVAVSLGGGVYTYATASHPLGMPATVAGLPKIDRSQWPTAVKQETDKAVKEFQSAGARNVAIGVYGGVTSAFVAVAGRVSGTMPAVEGQQFLNGVSVGAAGSSLTATTVQSGASTYECATTNAAGQLVAACMLTGHHLLLLGVGVSLDAQATADGLEQIRFADGLT